MLSAAEFAALAEQGYNRIPLTRQVLADLDTPLSTYLKLAKGEYSCLFESVQGGEKWGRFSIIGLPAREQIRVYGQRVEQWCEGQLRQSEEVEDPLAWIEHYQQQFRVASGEEELPRFHGGLVGYFGYDTVRYIEPKLRHSPNPDQLQTPDILLLLCEEVVIFDNLKGVIEIIVLAESAQPESYGAAIQRLQQLQQQLERPLQRDRPRASVAVGEADFISGFTEEGFKAAVAKSRQYITEGDIMQVVLSQRLSIPFRARPIDLYRALRKLNPSPYMFFLDLGDHQVVGSSPEILVRFEEGRVTVRPIAGTRPRGLTEAEDAALREELLHDPKELAEHLMLIDLGRNDTGRIATIGSVQVTEQMAVENYSHVMHIVSNVEGELKPGLSAMDVLRATFPAGTVSGAPKIRAMEIIDELEPVKRGIYAGAVGYLGWNGNMDTAIAIRTAVIKENTLYMQAGAGIVYDSIPQNEWDETMNKSRAIFRAAELACKGL
ncbi:anthranilate synthase component I [Ectothiorhodospiraceae bacterium BW-2]|nr:anthranilate synthase component I [Ectothiorhodospiraceae bacterium BW-2]